MFYYIEIPRAIFKGSRRVTLERDNQIWLFWLIGGGGGGGEMPPRKSVTQSACQYDVTSRVRNFQNGEQSDQRRDG